VKRRGKLTNTRPSHKNPQYYHGYVCDLGIQHVEALERIYSHTQAAAEGKDYPIQAYLRVIVDQWIKSHGGYNEETSSDK
jgi:hypothetical protein